VKKRKLNSTNPKYYPVEEQNNNKERKVLITDGRIKAYAVFVDHVENRI
jgi:hypothetical protein|tara:strand:+ start:255 stop:401 length:147 start_codon:yes stop_codon:yes gene_type:complete